MSDEKRPIIRFQLNFEHDAKPHNGFFYAPGNWGDMTEAEREKFLEDESKLWREEQVDYSYKVYADEAEAEAADHGWGGYYDEPEERW